MAVRRHLGEILVREHEQLDVRRQHAPQHGGEIVQQVPRCSGSSVRVERRANPSS